MCNQCLVQSVSCAISVLCNQCPLLISLSSISISPPHPLSLLSFSFLFVLLSCLSISPLSLFFSYASITVHTQELDTLQHLCVIPTLTEGGGERAREEEGEGEAEAEEGNRGGEEDRSSDRLSPTPTAALCAAPTATSTVPAIGTSGGSGQLLTFTARVDLIEIKVLTVNPAVFPLYLSVCLSVCLCLFLSFSF